MFVHNPVFFSLWHFGHLPHNSIKIRRNSIHYSVFSRIMTELPWNLSVIKKKQKSYKAKKIDIKITSCLNRS